MMGPRVWLVTLLAACGGMPSSCGPQDDWITPVPSDGVRRPWVLVHTIDTLRTDALSAHGQALPTTPTIDAWVTGGVDVTRAYAPIARTTPSLASMWTGRYPHGHGVRRLHDEMDVDITTLAELAKAAGYRTAAFVSNHNLPPSRRLDQGFDTYVYQDGYAWAADTVNLAIDWLAQLEGDEPVLLWVHTIEPHTPYWPEDGSVIARFDPGYRGRYARGFGSSPRDIRPRPYPPELGKRRAVFHNPLDERTTEHVRRLYLADVHMADRAARAILGAWKYVAPEEHVVVISSDHGEAWGEHDYHWDHGDFVWEQGLRIPLVFGFGPGWRGPRGITVDTPVSLVDLAPTLAQAMSLSWPEDEVAELEGRSIWPALRGEPLPVVPVFAEAGHSFFPRQQPGRVANTLAGRLRAVVHGDDKVIWVPGAEDVPEYRLFDVVADPLEQEDRSAAAPGTFATLKAELQGWLRDEIDLTAASAEDMDEPDTDEVQALKALGYME